MTSPNRPIIIAIDGRSGAGKTTLAVELAALLRRHRTVSLFHLEDIYPGWDGLSAGVERYISTVLAPLHQGVSALWRAWDWEKKNDGDSRTTAVADVVLLEGVGAAHGGAREFIDATIWIETPSESRKDRALARDGETYAPFWDVWAAQEELLLAQDLVAEDADLVVDGSNGVANTAAPVLAALTSLPFLETTFAPELASRRGLEFAAQRVDIYPAADALFTAVYGAAKDAVWLDSSIADTPSGKLQPAGRARFSIMADSSGHFGQLAQHASGVTTVVAGPVTTRIRTPFFRWLDSVWGRKAVRAPLEYDGDFTLGWLGYLGYELKHESGGSFVASPAGQHAASLIFAGRAVVIDHQQKCLFLLTLCEASQPATAVEAAAWADSVKTVIDGLGTKAGRETEAASEGELPASFSPKKASNMAPTFQLRDDRERYLALIAQALAEIRDGNSYEVCLTTQLQAHASTIDSFGLYQQLREVSPAPFSAYLKFGDLAVCSSSPERFLRVDAAGAMRAEPIKGTRRRDADPLVDAALVEDLRTSLKDRAENVMIVDLLRNDLSHFARPGSVQVPRLCQIESYATVHQLVSTIEAQLIPGSSRAEAVAAAFPAGSMTGAPKISTMAILDQLEDGPRGIYSGAVGYFSLNAASDLSVAIRTLVMTTDELGTSLSLGVGGAITADSDPAAEWDEIAAKAFGVLSTLGAQFPGGST